MTALPASSRYCLGRSAFMRLPTPAAGTTAQNLIESVICKIRLRRPSQVGFQNQFIVGATLAAKNAAKVAPTLCKYSNVLLIFPCTR